MSTANWWRVHLRWTLGKKCIFPLSSFPPNIWGQLLVLGIIKQYICIDQHFPKCGLQLPAILSGPQTTLWEMLIYTNELFPLSFIMQDKCVFYIFIFYKKVKQTRHFDLLADSLMPVALWTITCRKPFRPGDSSSGRDKKHSVIVCVWEGDEFMKCPTPCCSHLSASLSLIYRQSSIFLPISDR